MTALRRCIVGNRPNELLPGASNRPSGGAGIPHTGILFPCTPGRPCNKRVADLRVRESDPVDECKYPVK